MIDEEIKSFVKDLEDLFLNPKYDDFVEQREELIKIIDGRSLDAEAIEYLFLGLEGKANNFAWTLSTEATATPKQKEQLKNHNYEENAQKIIGDDFLKYRKSIQNRKEEKLQKYKSENAAKGGRGNKNKPAYDTMKEWYDKWQKNKSLYKNQERYIEAMIDKTNAGRSTVLRNIKEYNKNI